MTKGSYDPFEKARTQALRLLQTRSRSTDELRRFLLKAHYAVTIVERILARLTEVGLLDDRRFAVERAAYLGQRRGQGPRKLRVDLSCRGIAAELIETAITQAYQPVSADQMMREVLKRRFGERVLADTADAKLRAKAQRFLLSRGFEPDSVFALFS
jgi:regulatory protein